MILFNQHVCALGSVDSQDTKVSASTIFCWSGLELGLWEMKQVRRQPNLDVRRDPRRYTMWHSLYAVIHGVAELASSSKEPRRLLSFTLPFHPA